MRDCLFCKIAKGEVPSFKIYEDGLFLAFLDIFPLTPGHTLVVPKQHYRWVWDVEPVGEYFAVIRKLANHFRQVLGKELVASMTLGEMVPHAHYHLLPESENLDKFLGSISGFRSKTKLDDRGARKMVKILAR